MTDTPLEIAHYGAVMTGVAHPESMPDMFCGTAQPHSAAYWLGVDGWHRCPGFVERRAVEPHEHTIKLNDHDIQIVLSNLRVTAFNYKAARFTRDYLAVARVIQAIERQSAE